MTPPTAKHRIGLNEAQLEAVKTTAGPLLVLAGAGTGKTRVVTCRIAEILSKGVPPSAILAVTFTNKAAREMRERVAKLLGGSDPAGMVLGTFHALGLRVLREFGPVMGIAAEASIADDSDQLTILEDALREVGVSRKVLSPRDAKFRLSGWKGAGITPDDAHVHASEETDFQLAMAYKRYDAELARRRLLDFDDLILRPLQLVREYEEVRATLQDRWRYVMVDEYQDTSAVQFELVRTLSGERRNLCVVGDDDQSIYGWRGAAADRILRFTRDVPGAKVVTLTRNYRSTAPILEAANALIAHNRTRREKVLVADREGGEAVKLYLSSDEKDELDWVVSRVQALRTGPKVPLEEMAILFRAKTQCRPLETALRAREIPYRVVGARSFFDRREVRDLLCYLRLVRTAADDTAFLRVGNVPPRGIGKASIDRLITAAAERRTHLLPAFEAGAGESLPAKAQASLQQLSDWLATLRERSRRESPAVILEAILEETRYRDYLRGLVDDAQELQTRLKVIDELVESAQASARAPADAMLFDPNSAEAQAAAQAVPGSAANDASGAPDASGGAQAAGAEGGDAGLSAFLDGLALREDKRDGEQDKAEGLTLLTMHAAKGLEYRAVFIVGVEEGTLPHRRSLAEAEHESEEEKLLEEERRLLYVGLTRARERLHLSHAKERARFGRPSTVVPSRFLDEIGRDLLEIVDEADEVPADTNTGKAWLSKIRSQLGSGSSWEDTFGVPGEQKP